MASPSVARDGRALNPPPVARASHNLSWNLSRCRSIAGPRCALVQFLDAWHDGAWQRMSLWTAHWWNLTRTDPVSALHDQFATYRLRGARIMPSSRTRDHATFEVKLAMRTLAPRLEKRTLRIEVERWPGKLGGGYRWGVDPTTIALPGAAQSAGLGVRIAARPEGQKRIGYVALARPGDLIHYRIRLRDPNSVTRAGRLRVEAAPGLDVIAGSTRVGQVDPAGEIAGDGIDLTPFLPLRHKLVVTFDARVDQQAAARSTLAMVATFTDGAYSNADSTVTYVRAPKKK